MALSALRVRTLSILIVFLALLARPALAQGLWPDANYDPDVPSLKGVLGYAPGEEITTHADMIRYVEALADYAPDRVKIFDYGETWEGRRLIYLAVSSAENMARLDDIKAGVQALANPRQTDEDEAESLIKDLPALVWLAYSVHGNEISSTDAAMQTLYHLLAARADDRVPETLEKTVVFINPLQNPDGRDRFIHRFEIARGLEPSSDRLSAEHNEPWPSGRTNHYLFDLNRDWIALTQPETKGHVAALQEWYPQVFVDLHEMGGDNNYYFAPEAVPYNPHLVESQRASLFDFGRTNAGWFDRFGREYFTRDVYDAFYPGYGASWPAYYGAVAMTYEQASSRGLVFRKDTGEEMTYRDTVMGHFITSLATAETTAATAKKLLRNFYEYQVSAIEEGRAARGFPRSYIFPDGDDDAKARKLAEVLRAQGIEIGRATEDFRACGTRYTAGTYVIDAAQTRARMIRTLLEPQVDMDRDFVAEQERRRALDYDHDIYDVTGWSLPLMFNVRMDRCDDATNARTTAALADPGGVSGPAEAVAWLVDGANGVTPEFIAAGHRAGLSMRVHTEGFTHNDVAYGRGTLIIPRGRNNPDVAQTVARIARQTGAKVTAIDDSWVDAGRDLASRQSMELVAPRVAMAWDEPTSSYSAGNSRFVIERQIGYPVTAIRTSDLAGADLRRYDVLVLPDTYGGYARAFSKRAIDTLKDWVSRGGVIVAQDGAVGFLTGDDVGLLSTKPESQVTQSSDAPEQQDSGRLPGTVIENAEQFRARIEPVDQRPDSVPGVLMKARADQDHWLTAGVKPDQTVLVRGSEIFAPLTLDNGRNVITFGPRGDNLASGYVWQENQAQLAFKPFVMVEEHGRGMVIAFTQEPTVRAYLDGLNQIYANALFLGPAMARPVR